MKMTKVIEGKSFSLERMTEPYWWEIRIDGILKCQIRGAKKDAIREFDKIIEGGQV